MINTKNLNINPSIAIYFSREAYYISRSHITTSQYTGSINPRLISKHFTHSRNDLKNSKRQYA